MGKAKLPKDNVEYVHRKSQFKGIFKKLVHCTNVSFTGNYVGPNSLTSKPNPHRTESLVKSSFPNIQRVKLDRTNVTNSRNSRDIRSSFCFKIAQYLGSTVVKELRGTESTKKSIQKLKKTCREPRVTPDITLAISYRGVRFLNTMTNVRH